MTQGNAWVDASPSGVREQPSVGEDWRDWLPSDPAGSAPVPDEAPVPTERPTGPLAPQPHVSMPEDPLPITRKDASVALWVVGAHGGAGESTLADLDEGWAAAEHSWPELDPGQSAACVIAARTSVRGLLAARSALTQWAASGAGDSVELLGLVLVADAPGKLPAPIRDLAKVVGGGAPRVWHVPWVEAWRLGAPVGEHVPRPVSNLVSALRSLAAPSHGGAVPSISEEKS